MPQPHGVDARREWRRIETDAFRVESRKVPWAVAIAGSVVVAGPLAVGAASDRDVAGLYVALGALNLGLGVAGSSLHRRWVRGLAVLVGQTLAALVAVAIHSDNVLAVILTLVLITTLTLSWAGDRQDALLGFVVGAVLVIVAGLDNSPGEAPLRAAQIGAGGVIALPLFLLTTRDQPEPASTEPLWRAMWQAARRPNRVRAHAIRTGVTTAISTALERALDLGFGYWVPLTTLAVLQPDGHSSSVRAVQRATGTIVGVALVAAIAEVTTDRNVIIALVAVSAFGLFALREWSYHWLVTLLTPTALLMISVALGPGQDLAMLRLRNTAIGIVLALAATGLSIARQRLARRDDA